VSSHWSETTTSRVASGLLRIAADFDLLSGTLVKEFTPFHLPDESWVQELFLSSTQLVQAANSYYAAVHFPATLACLVWLYLRRPAHYLWFRRTIVALTAVALVVPVLYPLAPPRMMAGFVDTGDLFGPDVYGPPDGSIANQFAAMPSLHVGWALLVAIALVWATSSKWRWLWFAHPVITLLVVVATANHYWLDGIAAAGILAATLAVGLGMPGALRLDRDDRAVGEGVGGDVQAVPRPLDRRWGGQRDNRPHPALPDRRQPIAEQLGHEDPPPG
jgi:hypothetical protein